MRRRTSADAMLILLSPSVPELEEDIIRFGESVFDEEPRCNCGVQYYLILIFIQLPPLAIDSLYRGGIDEMMG